MGVKVKQNGIWLRHSWTWFLIFGGVLVVRAQNSDTTDNVEAFKAFLHDPGTIERLIVSQEFPSMQTTNLYYIRWQSNAELVAQSGGAFFPEKLPKREDLTSYQYLNSRYENNYWHKVQNSMSYWTDTDNPADKTRDNAVWFSFGQSHVLAWPLMSGGVFDLPMGRINWSGDTFICTNNVGWRIQGTIQRDDINHRVAGLRLECRGAYATNANFSAVWNYAYGYDKEDCTNCPAYYPSYIYASHNGYQIVYRVYDLVRSNAPLAEAEYALKWADFSDVVFEHWYTNGTQAFSNHIGPNILAKRPSPPRLEVLDEWRRPLIFSTLILTSCVFGVLLYRTARNSK